MIPLLSLAKVSLADLLLSFLPLLLIGPILLLYEVANPLSRIQQYHYSKQSTKDISNEPLDESSCKGPKA